MLSDPRTAARSLKPAGPPAAPPLTADDWPVEIVFDAAPAAPASPPVASDRETMLADELHHRVQNTLSVVLALARLTARSATTVEAFQIAFSARIQAMARTNALLLRGHVQAVDVRTAIEVELEAYAGLGSQVTLQCDAIRISADAALSLSLLIHELATNAAKYGALSVPAGRLVIRCARAADGGGVLTWRETTPGLVATACAPGQGSRLIRHLARDLGGAAEIDILPGGLQATVHFRSRAADA